MLNTTYRDRKTNIWVREKTKFTDVIELVRRRKWTWAEQGTSAGYEITDGHCVSSLGNPTKGKDRGKPARSWRDELDDYCKVTIWQTIVQDRQMLKQHA